MRILVWVAFLTALASRVSGANVAPTIFGTPTYAVVLPNAATLAALVTDDGLPAGSSITSLWTQVSGPGTVTFSNASTPITRAAFSQPGTYVLRLTSSDGLLTSTQDTTITVYPSPLTLHVMFAGTGSGTVNGQSSNYTTRFPRSTFVVLTATPADGSTFVGWAGTGYTGSDNPCTVSVDSAKHITAFFDLKSVATNCYYVATNGNDANSGRLGYPWRTIQHAASTATNGSRIIIRAGEYNEFVTAQKSGTAALPIIFEGERAPNGDWLTIIDPSTPITNGWVRAPEISAMTWKRTNLPFDPKELTIDHQRVYFVYTLGDLTKICSIYDGITNGIQYFRLAPDALVTLVGNHSMRFWDGLEAIWYSTNGTPKTCYIRFRNGDDPNGRNIRVAPNQDGLTGIAPGNGGRLDYAAISCGVQSNLVFRNLSVRGAFGQVKLGNLAAGSNTAENNHLATGWSRVYVGNHNATGMFPSYCIIRNNEIVSDYYGYGDAGARQQATGYRYVLRNMLYQWCKYMMGVGNTFDQSIVLYNAGDGTRICGNHVHRGGGGDAIVAYTDGYPPSSRDSVICDNVIENQSSVGLLLLSGHRNLRVFDNFVSDCNINVRLGMIDKGDTDRLTYIYRNRFWLPDGAGNHFFFHYADSKLDATHPECWVYHNSFSGGFDVFDWNSCAYGSGGSPAFRFLNNLLSCDYAYQWYPAAFGTDAGMVGAFDYNLLKKSGVHPAWYLPNNIEQEEEEWGNAPDMGFDLAPGSLAVDMALDLSRPFSVKGVEYPALPQTDLRRNGSGWDIGAKEAEAVEVLAAPSNLSPVWPPLGR